MASDQLDPTQMTQRIIMLEHTQGTQLVEPLRPYCFRPLKKHTTALFLGLDEKSSAVLCRLGRPANGLMVRHGLGGYKNKLYCGEAS